MAHNDLRGSDLSDPAVNPSSVDFKWRKLGTVAAIASVSLLAAAFYVWKDAKRAKKVRERIYRLD